MCTSYIMQCADAHACLCCYWPRTRKCMHPCISGPMPMPLECKSNATNMAYSHTHTHTGFIALRDTPASFKLLGKWQAALEKKTQLNQPVFNEIIRESRATGWLRHKPLLRLLFQSGKHKAQSTKHTYAKTHVRTKGTCTHTYEHTRICIINST
jgi:hypothetical protein